MENDVIITIQHAKKLKYCARGIRNFCAMYGISYLHFVKNGIPASRLEQIGDPLGLALIEVAKDGLK